MAASDSHMKRRSSTASLEGTYLAGLNHKEVQEEIVFVFAEVLKKTREKNSRHRADSESNTKHRETGTLASISDDWAEAWSYARPSSSSHELWLGGLICKDEGDEEVEQVRRSNGGSIPLDRVTSSDSYSGKDCKSPDEAQSKSVGMKQISFKVRRDEAPENSQSLKLTSVLVSPRKVQYHVRTEDVKAKANSLENTCLYSSFSSLPSVHSEAPGVSTPRKHESFIHRRSEPASTKYDWSSEIAKIWSAPESEKDVLSPLRSLTATEPVRPSRSDRPRYFQTGETLVSRWKSISKLPHDKRMEQVLTSCRGRIA